MLQFRKKVSHGKKGVVLPIARMSLHMGGSRLICLRASPAEPFFIGAIAWHHVRSRERPKSGHMFDEHSWPRPDRPATRSSKSRKMQTPGRSRRRSQALPSAHCTLILVYHEERLQTLKGLQEQSMFRQQAAKRSWSHDPAKPVGYLGCRLSILC